MKTQGGNLSERASESFIRRRFSYIVNELKTFTGSLLVIGSGDGCFEQILKSINPSVIITSIDINKDFAERTETYADKLIIDDFLTHTFSETYDCLVSIDVIEHIVETDAFLKKSRSLLNEHARFYLQTPNLASWHGRVSLLFGFLPAAMEVSDERNYFGKSWPFRYDEPIHHVRVFTLGALKELCAYHGFTVQHTEGIDQGFGALLRLFPSFSGSFCLKLTT